jgi:hypothetical protein
MTSCIAEDKMFFARQPKVSYRLAWRSTTDVDEITLGSMITIISTSEIW